MKEKIGKGMDVVVVCSSSSPLISSSNLHVRSVIPSSSPLVWGQRRRWESSLVGGISRGQAFCVLANSKVTPGKGGSSREVTMVEPLEAKRLAAKQMEELRGREKLKRRREIEAINGTWAMIGLTAGLVMEAQTGKGILAQIASYWASFLHFFNG